MRDKDIFERLRAGESIPMNDPDYKYVRERVNITLKLSQKMNNATHVDEVRKFLECRGFTVKTLVKVGFKLLPFAYVIEAEKVTSFKK